MIEMYNIVPFPLNIGFIRACKMGCEGVVKILLQKVNNVRGMMELGDAEERTGFVEACKFGKGVIQKPPGNILHFFDHLPTPSGQTWTCG